MLLHSVMISIIFIIFLSSSSAYEPNWKSLDSRPLPAWYDEAKFGVFSTWGLYSVPGFWTEWFWWYWKGPQPNPDMVAMMKKLYNADFTYGDFAPMFTTELFDPEHFANIVKNSGAKYYILTSKHCDGYTLWPSKYAFNWNSQDVGPNRDLVGDLQKAFKKRNIRYGLYYCMYEWFNRHYLDDKKSNYTTDSFVKDVSFPEMQEIVNDYQPDIFWNDGDWEAPDTYWKSKEFLTWLYNDSPIKDKVVVNDRWGQGDTGLHGGYLTFNDHFDPGHIIPRKWENIMMMEVGSWGFRKTMTASDVVSSHDLITQLARTISCNGNYLINVGPTHDGRIVPVFEERLNALGNFLKTNGEAVYKTKPWIYTNDSNVWYTSKVRFGHRLPRDRAFNPQKSRETIVFAFVLDWPHGGMLYLPSVKPTSKTIARMLGYNQTISIRKHINGAALDLSRINWRDLPSLDSWVIKFEHLASEDRNPVLELVKTGILSPEGFPVSSVVRHYTEKSAEYDMFDEILKK